MFIMLLFLDVFNFLGGGSIRSIDGCLLVSRFRYGLVVGRRRGRGWVRVIIASVIVLRGVYYIFFNKGYFLNSVINKVYICYCKMGEIFVLIEIDVLNIEV